MDIKEAFANMSGEFKEKAKKCQSLEELNELIKGENIELTPEQTDALAGGDILCPRNYCVFLYCDTW